MNAIAMIDEISDELSFVFLLSQKGFSPAFHWFDVATGEVGSMVREANVVSGLLKVLIAF